MTRSLPIFSTLLVCFLLLSACVEAKKPASNSEKSSTDKAAPDTEEPQNKAARVISLSPSATELCFALGAGDRVVGVDKYSIELPGAEKLPTVGDFLSPSFAEIAKLKPTLIIADSLQAKVIKTLKGAGYEVLVLPMHTVSDVLRGIDEAARALAQKEAGAKLRSLIEAQLKEARAAAPENGPRVLVVLDREPGGLGGLVAAGPGSYADELIVAAGGKNVLADSKVRYPRISAETVLRSDPQVILDGAHGGRDAKDWARSLPTISAVKAGRIHPIRDRAFTAPSPRLGEAVEALGKLLYPK